MVGTAVMGLTSYYWVTIVDMLLAHRRGGN
ncbi:hypothetical protein PSET11_02401 [Arthrobacter ulcerisalmonis]|uniref:Uncharacterized protein n=1 Tax=Arthrobacter ulcerisalmonis TaxID=2483813 RepID=A0A3P5XN91_9MICC|nr:hypothetical protein PSET11_02401 [Arthrobacter ulcerisalmonis]